MCGVLAFIGECDLAGALSLRGALARLRHRGPDDEGLLLLGMDQLEPAVLDLREPVQSLPAGAFVILGNTRLAILDTSVRGRQPMGATDRQVWVTYNGEIYNYVELRQELRERGHAFQTDTDTEVLLRAYVEWGEECLVRLNGMWSFVLWDAREHKLLAAVDQYGIKPLYYAPVDGGLLLVSEPGVIWHHDRAATRPNYQTIRRYLVYNLSAFRGETFFQTIRVLSGGEKLTSNGVKVVEPTRWWHHGERPPSASERGSDRILLLRTLLQDSVRLRLRSDVPVGACLSGGLDSSTIVALMRAEVGEASLTTFTAAYDDVPECDERQWAVSMSEACRTDMEIVRPQLSGLRDDLEDLVATHGEPCQGLTVYAQYCVMRRAREIGVPVVLDGQGADELFWGYDWHYAVAVLNRVRQGGWWSAIHELMRIKRNRDDISLGRIAALLAYNRSRTLRRAWNIRQSQQFLTRDFLTEFETDCVVPGSLSPWALRVMELEETPLPTLLRYEDRNSMRWSVESRLPFLDPRVVELALSLEAESLVREGWSKWPLRESMARVLPESVRLRRTKLGFSVPDVRWMLGLSDVAEDVFSAHAHSNRLIRGDRVVAEIRRGSRQPTRLWRALNVELWMRWTGMRS